MGAYLSSPVTEKESEDGENRRFKFGASAMQGWRVDMEDAHIADLSLDPSADAALFGVFDGHGGAEVARYAARHVSEVMRSTEAWCQGDTPGALSKAYLDLDQRMLAEGAREELEQLKRSGKARAGGDGGLGDGALVLGHAGGDEAEGGDGDGGGVAPPLRASQLSPRLLEYLGITPPGSSDGTGSSGFRLQVVQEGDGRPPLLGMVDSNGNPIFKVRLSSDSDDDSSDEGEDGEEAEDGEEDGEEAEGEDAEEAPAGSSAATTSVGASAASPLAAPRPGEKKKKGERGLATPASGSPSPSASEDGAVEEAADGSTTPGAGKRKRDLDRKRRGARVDGAGGDEGGPGSTSSSGGSRDAHAGGEGGGDLEGADGSAAGEGEAGSRAEAEAPGAGASALADPFGSVPAFVAAPTPASGDGGGGDPDEAAEDLGDEEDIPTPLPLAAEPADEATAGSPSASGYAGPTAGCTAVVAVVRGNSLVVANAGDSRAVLSRGGRAVDLTEDHKPNNPVEYARILKAGGFVADGRVNGSLNLSRALGDMEHKRSPGLPPEAQCVTAAPEVRVERLLPGDEFLVLACDGIWDVLTNQEAVDEVRALLLAGKTPRGASEELCSLCLAPDMAGSGKGCDNMSVMVVILKGYGFDESLPPSSLGQGNGADAHSVSKISPSRF